MPRVVGPPLTLAIASSQDASFWWRGRMADVEPVLERWLALPERAKRADPAKQQKVLLMVIGAAISRSDFDRAELWLDRAEPFFDASSAPNSDLVVTYLGARATVAVGTRRFPEAQRHLDRVLAGSPAHQGHRRRTRASTRPFEPPGARSSLDKGNSRRDRASAPAAAGSANQLFAAARFLTVITNPRYLCGRRTGRLPSAGRTESTWSGCSNITVRTNLLFARR
jgi:hypothetical protein